MSTEFLETCRRFK